ncbi:hypothetical protein MTP03_00780 [Tsukamurella sp. PLM1]|nr:hypothetical protein MTP03_00780 [Tsukamurella sp. PLM1]
MSVARNSFANGWPAAPISLTYERSTLSSEPSDGAISHAEYRTAPARSTRRARRMAPNVPTHGPSAGAIVTIQRLRNIHMLLVCITS